MSRKHLDRYVQEFAGRHNIRTDHPKDQMAAVVAGIMGRRLMYRDLIAKSEKAPDSGSDVFQASGLPVPSFPSSAVASSDGPILRARFPSAG